jgi:CheY-like chemotaxis protein
MEDLPEPAWLRLHDTPPVRWINIDHVILYAVFGGLGRNLPSSRDNLSPAEPAATTTSHSKFNSGGWVFMDKKPLILVVDDSAEYRELLIWTLEMHGFRTMSAGGGREAVELAIDYQPDLVLMDLNMPGMNGYEATGAIHAHRHGRKISVVAVSADCVDGFERWCFQAGFVASLAKPWEQAALLEIVKKALARRVASKRAA